MQKYKTLISGGTRGIGLVTKRMLEKRGDLVTTFSRSPSSINHIQMPIDKFDYKLLPYKKYDNLIFTHRYRGDDGYEDLKITVNSLFKILDNCKFFLSNDSSIVILGSNASKFVFFEQNSLYHASRAALTGINNYYSVKLGKFGIRCNIVNPGTVIKPENKNFYSENLKLVKNIENLTPLKKMGKAEDVANLVLFLCSKNSNFITGQNISVDGGLSNISQESINKLT